jgi:integrase
MRISEALAVVWSQVDFEAGTVQITGTLIRVKGEGPLRKGTKVEPARDQGGCRHASRRLPSVSRS